MEIIVIAGNGKGHVFLMKKRLLQCNGNGLAVVYIFTGRNDVVAVGCLELQVEGIFSFKGEPEIRFQVKAQI